MVVKERIKGQVFTYINGVLVSIENQKETYIKESIFKFIFKSWHLLFGIFVMSFNLIVAVANFKLHSYLCIVNGFCGGFVFNIIYDIIRTEIKR